MLQSTTSIFIVSVCELLNVGPLIELVWTRHSFNALFIRLNLTIYQHVSQAEKNTMNTFSGSIAWWRRFLVRRLVFSTRSQFCFRAGLRDQTPPNFVFVCLGFFSRKASGLFFHSHDVSLNARTLHGNKYHRILRNFFLYFLDLMFLYLSVFKGFA